MKALFLIFGNVSKNTNQFISYYVILDKALDFSTRIEPRDNMENIGIIFCHDILLLFLVILLLFLQDFYVDSYLLVIGFQKNLRISFMNLHSKKY